MFLLLILKKKKQSNIDNFNISFIKHNEPSFVKLPFQIELMEWSLALNQDHKLKINHNLKHFRYVY